MYDLNGNTLAHGNNPKMDYIPKDEAGVRDMFLELIIREDLKSSPRITPDSAPDFEILAPEPKK